MTVCRVCLEDKPAEEFGLRDANKGVRQTRCRPCIRAYSREWYKKNADTHRTNMRQWHQDNQDKKRAYREKNKEKYRLWDYNWRHANPIARRAAGAQYRAKKRQRTIQLNPSHHKMLKDYYRRARELTLKTGKLHVVDHLVPLGGETVCGLHVPWNLQILPANINVKKSNKLTLDTLAYSPVNLTHVD